MISIHAPREGSDAEITGETPNLTLFQSTLPVRGATWNYREGGRVSIFQSTLPVRGATPHSAVQATKNGNFNPRSP